MSDCSEPRTQKENYTVQIQQCIIIISKYAATSELFLQEMVNALFHDPFFK